MSFKIDVQPAGLSFQVDEGETILAAAIRQGIGLPYGCKDGACGSCKSRLLQGRVEHGAHQHKALSVAEEEAGLVLTCCARPQGDCTIEARSVPGAGEFPVRKLPVRVIDIDKPAPDVAIVRLQLPAHLPFEYHAGQYVEFLLAGGARRSYSMANPPPHDSPAEASAAPALELHIRHLPGGLFTDQVFSTLKARDILRIEGPFGSFFLREDSSKPIVLLASGTGFAPVKALLGHMRAKGITRETVLYWGCRRRADLYQHDWAEQAAAELPWLRYVPVLSEPHAEDAWSGRTGLVHEAVMADLPDLSGHQVYACGAPVMVESAQRDFTARCGLPAQEFYADAFTSEADKHEDA